MQSQQQAAINQSTYLSTLSNVPSQRLKPFVESLLPHMGQVEVLNNRTGLIMVPGTDTVQGTNFHLGEVLVSEAHVRLHLDTTLDTGSDADGTAGERVTEGYGAYLGRDLELSLAVAILDAALQGNVMQEAILSFVRAEAQRQAKADDLLLRQVEATRIEMETF